MADNRAGNFAQMRNRRVFVGNETAFRTMFKPIATDALRVRTGGINPSNPTRVARDDNRHSRSVYDYIQGNTPPSDWSYQMFLSASGVAGTPPAYHKLLLAALGQDTYTNTPATSDAYLLTDTCQNRGSITAYEFYPACGSGTSEDGNVAETLTGAMVSSMTIAGSGTEPPTITFAGTGSRHASTSRALVGATGVVAAVANFDNGGTYRAQGFQVDSLVAFYEAADGTTVVDDNSNTGFRVTAVDYDNDQITLDASPVGVVATDICAPWAPTETISATEAALPGIDGSLSINAGAGAIVASVLDYEWTLENNDVLHDGESFQSHATGFHENIRTLTGRFRFKAKASDLGIMHTRTTYPNATIILTNGSVAGKIITSTIRAEADWVPMEKSADQTVICVMSFRGKASSISAKDEFQIVYT